MEDRDDPSEAAPSCNRCRRIERETLNLNREGQRFKNVLANYATQKYSVLIILKNNPASTPHIVLFLLVKAVVIAVARKSTINRNDLSSNILSSRQAQKGYQASDF